MKGDKSGNYMIVAGVKPLSDMSDDPKQRILDAAFKEFAANGKAGARMQSIAERAQVNQAMLNYYFKSKDELYLEVVRQSALMCHHKHPQLKIGDSPEQQKKAIFDHIERDIRFWAGNQDLLRITLHDLLAGGEGMKLALSEMVGHEETHNFDLMLAGRLFRSRDPRQIILHFTSLTLLALIPVEAIREIWPGSESPEDFLNARIAAVRDLLEHGIFTSSDSDS